jgi:hypothetical protein
LLCSCSLLRLQEKTGGLVILRTGTLIHLYRGPDYKGPPPRPKVNDITEAIGDQDLFGEDDDLEEGDLMQQFEVEDGICKSAVVTVVERYGVCGGPLLVRYCRLEGRPAAV